MRRHEKEPWGDGALSLGLARGSVTFKTISLMSANWHRMAFEWQHVEMIV